MITRWMHAKFLPKFPDAALLILRTGAGLTLFLRHGWEKFTNPLHLANNPHWAFSLLNPSFPDPMHIGHNTSWLFAMFSDGVCSVLIVLGLGTRWATLPCCATLLSAWALMHGFSLLGGSPDAHSGELIVLYLSPLMAILLLGPGRYSLDALMDKDSTVTVSDPKVR